jgi:hypothetical protein
MLIQLEVAWIAYLVLRRVEEIGEVRRREERSKNLTRARKFNFNFRKVRRIHFANNERIARFRIVALPLAA